MPHVLGHRSRRPPPPAGRRVPWAGVGLAGWLALAACAATPHAGSGPETPAAYHAGQIIATAARASVSYAEFGSRLQSADIIYLGEAHDTPSHVAAALRVLRTVAGGGRRPVLGMEMFSWDGQRGLDRYLGGAAASVEEFLAETGWRRNWGGHYDVYAPLVEYAQANGVRLLGLNPPRALVRRVARQGLAGIAHEAAAQRWPLPDPFPPDDREYRRVVYEQIEQCHKGLSQDLYQTIYDASVFRDEGMASVVAAAAMAAAHGAQTVVSYTGAGHMQYGLPVPKRVRRQSGGAFAQVTVYLHALDPAHPEDVEPLLAAPIADYVWLTAPGPQGRLPRCGEPAG